MKTLSNPFIIFAFIFLQTTFVLSQNHNTVVTPQKYNFSFSVMGGESIFSDRFILTDDSYSRAQPNLNVSATYYLSDSKALKVDAGYTFTKPYSGVLVDGVNYSVGSSKMFSSKLSFLVGRFKPNEHFMYNFSLGLGVHYWKEGSYTENTTYLNLADSTRFTESNTYEYKTEVNVLASIGGSVGYRFIKNFGVQIEAEYDMITGLNHNYFPVRGGVFYIF